MLNGIPSKWPRTFTVLGIGAAALLLLLQAMMLVIWSHKTETLLNIGLSADGLTQGQRDELKTLAAELTNEIPHITSFFAYMNEKLSNAEFVFLTVFGTFVAYVIGELIVLSVRHFPLLVDSRQVGHIERVARCAIIDNPIISMNFERYETNSELLWGLTGLSFIFSLNMLVSVSYSFSLLGLAFGLACLFAGPWGFMRYQSRLRDEFDGILSEYEQQIRNRK